MHRVSLVTDSLHSIPDTWFTHSGIWGEPRCRGRSVNRWTNASRFVARPARGREDGPAVPGVRHLPRHRLQALQPLSRNAASMRSTTASRRPYRHANKLPFQVERTIIGIKREHPSWGAPKIRDKLIRRLPDDQVAGHQHRPRRARSPWPGQAPQTPTLQGPGHRAHRRPRSPTGCCAPTSKASSCSATSSTAIR